VAQLHERSPRAARRRPGSRPAVVAGQIEAINTALVKTRFGRAYEVMAPGERVFPHGRPRRTTGRCP
jgi:hypothetical protein